MNNSQELSQDQDQFNERIVKEKAMEFWDPKSSPGQERRQSDLIVKPLAWLRGEGSWINRVPGRSKLSLIFRLWLQESNISYRMNQSTYLPRSRRNKREAGKEEEEKVPQHLSKDYEAAQLERKVLLDALPERVKEENIGKEKVKAGWIINLVELSLELKHFDS